MAGPSFGSLLSPSKQQDRTLALLPCGLSLLPVGEEIQGMMGPLGEFCFLLLLLLTIKSREGHQSLCGELTQSPGRYLPL